MVPVGGGKIQCAAKRFDAKIRFMHPGVLRTMQRPLDVADAVALIFAPVARHNHVPGVLAVGSQRNGKIFGVADFIRRQAASVWLAGNGRYIYIQIFK